MPGEVSGLAEGSPFYLSAVIRSGSPDKNLTTMDGLTKTLEFETLDDEGSIKSTWMEYVASAFPQINDRNAKHIVLHLCKHRDRELTREELLKDLNLDMSDAELEKKLKALVKADIINQGQTNFDYQGVKDNIFDKVFRGVYEKEIHEFDVRLIRQEYKQEFEKQRKQYLSLLGKHNYQKGYFAEYVILDQLKFHALAKNELLKSVTRYLPADFNFCDYSRVWRYHSSPESYFQQGRAHRPEAQLRSVPSLSPIPYILGMGNLPSRKCINKIRLPSGDKAGNRLF